MIDTLHHCLLGKVPNPQDLMLLHQKGRTGNTLRKKMQSIFKKMKLLQLTEISIEKWRLHRWMIDTLHHYLLGKVPNPQDLMLLQQNGRTGNTLRTKMQSIFKKMKLLPLTEILIWSKLFDILKLISSRRLIKSRMETDFRVRNTALTLKDKIQLLLKTAKIHTMINTLRV